CRSSAPTQTPDTSTLSLHDALPISKNVALKALAIAKGGITVVPNRACELSEGNILSSRSQRDTDTSATRTPANNVALQNFEKRQDRKSTRLNSSHVKISYAVFCLKK